MTGDPCSNSNNATPSPQCHHLVSLEMVTLHNLPNSQSPSMMPPGCIPGLHMAAAQVTARQVPEICLQEMTMLARAALLPPVSLQLVL